MCKEIKDKDGAAALGGRIHSRLPFPDSELNRRPSEQGKIKQSKGKLVKLRIGRIGERNVRLFF